METNQIHRVKYMKDCLICQTEISRSTSHPKRTTRAPWCVTCSKKCAKAYVRVYNHVRRAILSKYNEDYYETIDEESRKKPQEKRYKRGGHRRT